MQEKFSRKTTLDTSRLTVYYVDTPMKFWLLFITSLIIGISFSTGYLAWTAAKIPKSEIQKFEQNTTKNEPFSLLSPPKASLAGKITAITGEVSWESRIATEAAGITKEQPIQQGELVVTGASSAARLVFPAIGEISIGSLSEISTTQTLPESFVLEQTQGSARYSITSDKTISVRSYRILFVLTQGDAVITLDSDKRFITVSVIKGSATAAYNDPDAISTVQNIYPGESFTFDNEERSGVFN